MQAIDEFISLNQNVVKGEPELQEGEWQMIWSSQVILDDGDIFITNYLERDY